MVAGKLAAVTGGGRAYRVGGEEFSILFPGRTAKEIMPHLELLRSVIEVATFRVRTGEDRRSAARRAEQAARDEAARKQDALPQAFGGRDRRSSERRAEARRAAASRKKAEAVRPSSAGANRDLSVTVSMGAAEPTARHRTVEQVIQAADKALYRAKQSGRNRVELSTPPRTLKMKPRQNIA
jgi:GGDEF domain-containing protein